jgi:hypothetical protein
MSSVRESTSGEQLATDPTPDGIMQLGVAFGGSNALLSAVELGLFSELASAFGLLMSLTMLIEAPGGFDYTGADCQGWMRDAGFSETYAQHIAGPHSMVVAIR